jgi:hypothetical protein
VQRHVPNIPTEIQLARGENTLYVSALRHRVYSMSYPAFDHQSVRIRRSWLKYEEGMAVSRL